MMRHAHDEARPCPLITAPSSSTPWLRLVVGENCLIAGTSHQETEGGGGGDTDQSKPFYDLLQNPTLLRVRIYFTSSLERYINISNQEDKFLRERQRQQQTRDKF